MSVKRDGTPLGILECEILGSSTTWDQDRQQFFTAYVIRSIINGAEHIVSRRYRQFRAFNSDVRSLRLRERPHKKDLPRLTGKTWAPGTRGDVVAKRVVKLGNYLRDMRSVAHAYSSVRRLLTEFLSDRPSDAELPVDTFFQPETVSGAATAGRAGRFGSFGGRRNQSFSATSGRHGARNPRRVASVANDSGLEHDIDAAVRAATPRTASPSPVKEEPVDLCAACKQPLGENPIKWEGTSPASSPVPSEDEGGEGDKEHRDSGSARRAVVYWFCSKACENYFLAAREKGFSITDVGGHRELRDKRSTRADESSDPTRSKKRMSILPARWRFGGKDESDSDTAATPPKDAAVPPPPAGKNTQSPMSHLLNLFRPKREESPPGSDASPPVVEKVHKVGYLWKRGGFRGGRKSWKRRFFALKDRSLYYYRTSRVVLLGTMDLVESIPAASNSLVNAFLPGKASRDDTVLEPSSGNFATAQELPASDAQRLYLPSKLKPILFVVMTSRRSLYLCAESEEERASWIQIISEVVEAQKELARHEQHTGLDISPKPLLSHRHRDRMTMLDYIHQREQSQDGVAGRGKGGAEGVADDDNAMEGKQGETGGVVRSTSIAPDEKGSRSGVQQMSVDQSHANPPKPPRSVSVDPEADPPQGLAAGVDMPSSESDLVGGSDDSEVDSDLEGQSPVGRSAPHPSAKSPSTPQSGRRKRSSGGRATSGGNDWHLPAISSQEWELRGDEVEVTDRIGMGNFGEVFKGRLWGTDVAVKLIKTGSLNKKTIAALKDEVAILSQLRHPNVVLYLGASTRPPNVFIATEWCERGCLSDSLYSPTVPLSAASRVRIALQAAQGMCYLHSRRRGIIHRDLKSQNLLVTKDFDVKVADFGLTVVKQRKSMDESSGDSSMVQGAIGTPQWMAPEVMEGQVYDDRVDVYSFGIVLCELMARILPFSDRYRRFDFIDAVLEEGAVPTLPLWAESLSTVVQAVQRADPPTPERDTETPVSDEEIAVPVSSSASSRASLPCRVRPANDDSQSEDEQRHSSTPARKSMPALTSATANLLRPSMASSVPSGAVTASVFSKLSLAELTAAMRARAGGPLTIADEDGSDDDAVVDDDDDDDDEEEDEGETPRVGGSPKQPRLVASKSAGGALRALPTLGEEADPAEETDAADIPLARTATSPPTADEVNQARPNRTVGGEGERYGRPRSSTIPRNALEGRFAGGTFRWRDDWEFVRALRRESDPVGSVFRSGPLADGGVGTPRGNVDVGEATLAAPAGVVDAEGVGLTMGNTMASTGSLRDRLGVGLRSMQRRKQSMVNPLEGESGAPAPLAAAAAAAAAGGGGARRAGVPSRLPSSPPEGPPSALQGKRVSPPSQSSGAGSPKPPAGSPPLPPRPPSPPPPDDPPKNPPRRDSSIKESPRQQQLLQRHGPAGKGEQRLMWPVAVEDAWPGRVDEWDAASGDCSGVIRLLVEACLNRDADRRPAFEELVDILGTLLATPHKDFFAQLEAPRLREELAYGSAVVQSRACHELLHFTVTALLAQGRDLRPVHLLQLRTTDSERNSRAEGGRRPSWSSNDGSFQLIAAAMGQLPRLPFSLVESEDTVWSDMPSAVVTSHGGGPQLAVADVNTMRFSFGELLGGLASTLRRADVVLRWALSIPDCVPAQSLLDRAWTPWPTTKTAPTVSPVSVSPAQKEEAMRVSAPGWQAVAALLAVRPAVDGSMLPEDMERDESVAKFSRATLAEAGRLIHAASTVLFATDRVTLSALTPAESSTGNTGSRETLLLPESVWTAARDTILVIWSDVERWNAAVAGQLARASSSRRFHVRFWQRLVVRTLAQTLGSVVESPRDARQMAKRLVEGLDPSCRPIAEALEGAVLRAFRRGSAGRAD